MKTQVFHNFFTANPVARQKRSSMKMSELTGEIVKMAVAAAGAAVSGWLAASLRKVSPRQLDERLAPLAKEQLALEAHLAALEARTADRLEQLSLQYVTLRQFEASMEAFAQRIGDVNAQLTEMRHSLSELLRQGGKRGP
jgi:chromosome segregation ATPase